MPGPITAKLRKTDSLLTMENLGESNPIASNVLSTIQADIQNQIGESRDVLHHVDLENLRIGLERHTYQSLRHNAKFLFSSISLTNRNFLDKFPGGHPSPLVHAEALAAVSSFWGTCPFCPRTSPGDLNPDWRYDPSLPGQRLWLMCSKVSTHELRTSFTAS